MSAGHCVWLLALFVACGFAVDQHVFVPHAGDSEFSKRLSRLEETMQHTGKRHKTGFTETPLHLADGELLHQASACMQTTCFDHVEPSAACCYAVTHCVVCIKSLASANILMSHHGSLALLT